MANLSEELVAKFIDQMAGFQSELQALKSTQQTQADQISAQVAKQIEQVVGSLQSDLASRMVVKDDIDVKADERFRATGARDDASWTYKTNVSDFLAGTNNVSNQGTLQNQMSRMIEASVNAYAEGLATNNRYINAKWQQELRHADIATENQWESTQETANDALAGEIAKSTQVPPAATEFE